jgi:hypothetical protein
MDIGEVHFYKGNIHTQQCIAQGHAGVSKGARVKDNVVNPILSGIVNALNQFVFSITLQRLQLMAGTGSGISEMLIDLLQSFTAVEFWLTGTKQI